MSHTPTSLLTVYLEQGQRRKVGRLAIRDRRILFEYDRDFPGSAIEISPLQLPLRPGVSLCPDHVFEGLYGVFNDSLPDGWGRLLLDRTVERVGIQRGELNALDRLAYVGAGGMGALSYEPDRSGHVRDDAPVELDRLAQESAIILTGRSGEVFEELLRLNGSSGGARPKIVAQVSADKANIIHGGRHLEPGFAHWMIKFSSSHDPLDAGALEYAYSLMARAAGVEMAETHLFRTRKQSYFGTRRFDRQSDQRFHLHSLAGLLHADHRHPSIDYDTVLRAVTVLTKNAVDVDKAYALACFNVLAHNRDDHAKNFSFLLNETYEWRFAPAYDLTYSRGPAGEQSTMLLGEGKHPGVSHLRALGQKHDLPNARRILAQVQEAVSRWRDFAKEAGVSPKNSREVFQRLTALAR